jgi:hypothetical protein
MRTYRDEGDGSKVIVAEEKPSGEVDIFTISNPPDPHFTDADGWQYQESQPSWDAFLEWKKQFPGLS